MLTYRLIVLLTIGSAGCCCQRQLTMGAKFDPCNQAKSVESVNVQVILTK